MSRGKIGPDDPAAQRIISTTVEELRPPQEAPAPSPLAPAAPPKRRAPLIKVFGHDLDPEQLRAKIRAGVTRLGDSMMISFIVNATGTAFLYFTGHGGIDPFATAAYFLLGTATGLVYPAVKKAIRGPDDDGGTPAPLAP